MQKYLLNGSSSFSMAYSIVEMMEKLNISDEYIVVSKYYSVPNEVVAKNKGLKYIYLAYDSESPVAEDWIWDEIRYLYRHKPYLIVTVGKESADFYKSMGFNTYFLPLGYDDNHFKDLKLKRHYEIGMVGSIDDERGSAFYHRKVLVLDMVKFLTYIKREGLFTNQITYPKLSDFYSGVKIGFNDIIRGLNMRCFEQPSNGCFMLVNERIRELDYALKEGKHYMTYNCVSDLIGKCEMILDDWKTYEKKAQAAKKIILKYPLSANVKKMAKDCELI